MIFVNYEWYCRRTFALSCLPYGILNSHAQMKTYGAMPLEEENLVVKCNACKKPVLASNFSKHVDNCGKSKPEVPPLTDGGGSQLSARDSDASQDTEAPPVVKREKPNPKKRKNSAASIASDASEAAFSVPAKRPPTQTADKPPPEKKQKVKKEKPKPTPKVKAPIDLDKQCGVISGPNNMQCTRSLTCKSHSMGAKRAVMGRSQLYDVLLSAYQKKSIGRPQNNAVLGSDKKPLDGMPDGGTHAHNGNATGGVGVGVGDKEDAALDSDEEANAVLDAIRRTRPQPLAVRPMLFVRRRNHCFQIRDMLLDAITPRGTVTVKQEKGLDSLHGAVAGVAAGAGSGVGGAMNNGRMPNGTVGSTGPNAVEQALLENSRLTG
ncbi:hypothetical protein BC936DRAFT_146823 [Jimgerdemannia flammicorona]|uniref:Uncharacterized protein n=2 Tax=Jimgerdemannia flammicorona TaxID=994334 RepID=A0A433Q4W9_9FUNG|nr:hypothetical protein BC936DRAFT_146823 [Jimgerdemannia flammicorona]RUS24784.1 hypothetical protein BC938DRAFT_473071 [Jimgerdemannia flammicorona]